MKAKIGACLALTGGLAAAFVLALSAPAFAHEERTVGAYQIVVGWGDEPAYAGQKNSVQLILATKAGKPVLNLGDSLKVEVVFGEQQMELSFEPAFDVEEGFGTPGDYRAWIIPTTPGTYRSTSASPQVRRHSTMSRIRRRSSFRRRFPPGPSSPSALIVRSPASTRPSPALEARPRTGPTRRGHWRSSASSSARWDSRSPWSR